MPREGGSAAQDHSNTQDLLNPSLWRAQILKKKKLQAQPGLFDAESNSQEDELTWRHRNDLLLCLCVLELASQMMRQSHLTELGRSIALPALVGLSFSRS